MKFSGVEWSPHVFTQGTKQSFIESPDNDIKTVVSEESSSPVRRRLSGDSSSSLHRNNESDKWTSNFLADPSISFQSLSLHPNPVSPFESPVSHRNRSSVDGIISRTFPTRRIVKATRINMAAQRRQCQPTAVKISFDTPMERELKVADSAAAQSQPSILARREVPNTRTFDSMSCESTISLVSSMESSFGVINSSTSSKAVGSENLPILPQVVPFPTSAATAISSPSPKLPRPSLVRSKRLHSGSVMWMSKPSDATSDEPASLDHQTDRRIKRRRVNRNRAMNEHEFDSILYQINAMETP